MTIHNSTFSGKACEAYFQMKKFSFNNDLMVYKTLQYPIMFLGLVGNLLCLITLVCGKNLRIPHFHYYRAMALAELVYCICFATTRVIDITGGVVGWQRDQGIPIKLVAKIGFISHDLAAFKIQVISLFFSTTGYITMYMAIAIGFDRFTAVRLRRIYQRWSNKRKRVMAYQFIAFSLFMSCFVHSWDAIVQYQIKSHVVYHPCEANQSFRGITPEILMDRFYNQTLYWAVPRVGPDIYMTMKRAKNFYNITLRVAYPILLLFLTVFVIGSWLKYARRRQVLKGHPAHNSLGSYRQLRTRREITLFYLMMAVVLLAFIQVIPNEIKRFIQMYYSDVDFSQLQLCTASTLPGFMHAVNVYFWIQWLMLVGNVTTWTDRSLKFYFYVALNPHFRKSFITIVRQLLKRQLDARRHRSNAVDRSVTDACNGILLFGAGSLIVVEKSIEIDRPFDSMENSRV